MRWIVTASQYGLAARIVSADKADAAPVAHVFGRTAQEIEARARLIAAAPRMLALLQQIREEYRDTFDVSCEPGEGWKGSARLSAATGAEVEELLRTMEAKEETR